MLLNTLDPPTLITNLFGYGRSSPSYFVGPINLLIYINCAAIAYLSPSLQLSLHFLHSQQSFCLLYTLPSSLLTFPPPLLIIMAFYLLLVLILLVPTSNAEWPPSPGYFPSRKFRSMSFYQGFRNLWGPQHQSVDQNALTIWLDNTSGLPDF